ncbi:hypothetical protein GCM10023322_26350 [Rugosimonospora acidiphila]|uniref:histidine kinase n=1 Tax=Rugosimonospora acidiphila TaxID=556531 RepID=A0ABP9RQF0_9ACTN
MVGWTGLSRWRPWLPDVLLWVALSLPVALAAISPHGIDSGWRPALSLLVMAVAVATGRRYPLVALVIIVGWTLRDGNFAFAIPVMGYLVGVRMRGARAAAWVFAGIVAAGTLLNLVVFDTGAAMWFFLTATLLFAGVLPWLVGRYRRQRQELLRAGWERAERLEREREFVAEQSRLRERSRIAQDMHDSLGHELSLIALRAGALEVSADPDDFRRAAGDLRISAGVAIERLGEIIGVLRDQSDPVPLDPVRDSVTDLVERAHRSGLAVRLRLDGDPVAGEPMVDRAVYRVVQESLTNAAKHAPGAEVTVVLTNSAGHTAVSVTNGRPPAGPLPGRGPSFGRGPRSGGGTGLVGLAERVRLAGGTLRAGPYGGGFQLTARLPNEAHARAAITGAGMDGTTTGDPAAGGPGGTIADGPGSPASTIADVLDGPASGIVGGPDSTIVGGPDGASGDAPGGVHGGALGGVGGGRPGRVGGGGRGPAESGAEQQWRAARQRVRRSLAVVVVAPVAIAVVLGLTYYSFATFNSVLVAGDYAKLRLGESRADLASLLPARQALRRPAFAGHPAPAGANCEFYSDGNFPFAQATYRLCFSGGRLVAKDNVTGWIEQ